MATSASALTTCNSDSDCPSGNFCWLNVCATLTQVTADDLASCALTSSGAVQCWGDEAYGRLGNGSTSGWSTVPVAVTHLSSNVTALSVGAGSSAHTCALVGGGSSQQCWGLNNYGQLGNGTTINSATPVKVAGAGPVTSMAVGSYHTCAVTPQGNAECWGYNADGELGDGTTNPSNSPQTVLQSPSTPLTGVSAVVAGAGHSCAVAQGRVWCWGANEYGQLGNGMTFGGSTTYAVQVKGPLPGVTAIAAGGYHTCALLSNGNVWCWGYNYYGELGNGNLNNSSLPVQVMNLPSMTGIAAGAFHSCAYNSGQAECWGWNGNGELGNGNLNNSDVPVQVKGLQPGVTSMTGGDAHTCAVTSPLGNSAGACWGFDGYGELGNNSTTQSPIPVSVWEP